jgi:hypothetical protein
MCDGILMKNSKPIRNLKEVSFFLSLLDISFIRDLSPKPQLLILDDLMQEMSSDSAPH